MFLERAGQFVRLVALMSMMLLAPATAWGQEATPVAGGPLDPAAFSGPVTNPYFPLASVTRKTYEGTFVDAETGKSVVERVEEQILPDTVTIAGIEATVVEVHEYADGELIEHTLDYYAQNDQGDVYYLGEDVDVYEDGQLAGHEGAWRAGEGDNQAGLFMPAAPTDGMVFEQEQAPGIAEDRSTVVATGVEVTVPAGSFAGCIETEDVNPLDGETEHKIYCPGVGVVQEKGSDGVLELIAFAGGDASSEGSQ